MEIGPITGIRPISMVKPPSPAPDLSGVFAVEFRGRQQDESSNSSRRASRGLEKEAEDEGYFAYTPTLPGCFSNGRTVEDAKRNIREAVEQHLVSILSHAEPVPQNDRLVHLEELTVGIPE